ncbi:MAG: hypothetical protein V7K40_28405 [Nostoc sp.]
MAASAVLQLDDFLNLRANTENIFSLLYRMFIANTTNDVSFDGAGRLNIFIFVY